MIAPAAVATSSTTSPIRVMIVDDSTIVRGMVSGWIEETPDIKVAAIAVDGAQALKKLAKGGVDICLLDIEMPGMSGLEALPKLLLIHTKLRVIMASILPERDPDVALRALQLGAIDFIAKPSTNRLGGAEAYRSELLEKIRKLARSNTDAPPAPRKISQNAPPPPSAARAMQKVRAKGAAVPLQALIVAASTGGPSAICRVLERLDDAWRLPILIAQHMPADYTRTLARMIGQVSPLETREAEAGEEIRPGVIYIAPGDFHFTVRRNARGRVVAALDQEAPVNWCRPSADPLFRSAAEIWGAAAMGLILTGMGHDGRDGAAALVAKGGRIVAQDEATSVVWGMPGAVVGAGLAEQVLPLDDIAPFLSNFGRAVK